MDDRLQIKAQFEKIMNGAVARDVDAIMSAYWHDDNLVEYDIIPPLEFRGWDAVKANYQTQIDAFHGTIEGRWDDPMIHVSGDMGYAFNIQHWSFDRADGSRAEVDTRVSQLFKKISGEWLVVHEHVSIPIDYLAVPA